MTTTNATKASRRGLDVVSNKDYSTIAAAIAAAGVKTVFDRDTGHVYVNSLVNPTYDEDSSTLSRALSFDASILSIPAAKAIHCASWRQNLTLGNGSTAVGSYESHTLTGGDATSTYIGDQKTVSTSSAAKHYLYSAALVATGGASELYGLNLSLTSITGVLASKAINITAGASDTSILDGGVFFNPRVAAFASKWAYGINSDRYVQYQTAFIRACAGGPGKFIDFRNSADAASLLTVDNTGKLTSAVAIEASVFNTVTAGVLTVGAAGGGAALPATPSGYIVHKVAGTDFKIPYYAMV